MKLYHEINQKLKKIYKEFKKDKEDLTGWDLMKKIKEQSNYDQRIVNLLLYKLYQISYENKETIPLFIEELIEYFWSSRSLDESYLIRIKNKEDLNNSRQIFPKIACKKDFLINLLERLELNETVETYCFLLLAKEEELLHKNYFSENQIKKFNRSDVEIIDYLLGIFKKECKKRKIDLNKKIISLN